MKDKRLTAAIRDSETIVLAAVVNGFLQRAAGDRRGKAAVVQSGLSFRLTGDRRPGVRVYVAP